MTGLVHIADSLVDKHVGIIKSIHEIRQEPGAIGFVHFAAEISDIEVLKNKGIESSLWGFGASRYRERAITKAIGEAIERYCAAIYPLEDLPVSTVEAATFPCTQPDQFALYSNEQYQQPDFPFARFTKKLPVRWVAAFDINTAGIAYVPACMVFLPYRGDKSQGESPIAAQISTGLACHSTLAMAGIAGICEVVERDAVAIVWQARMSMPRIRLDTLSAANKDLISRFQYPGASIILLYLRMDHHIPVIMAAMRRSNAEAPALIISAAAHIDPELAVQKSLEELAQIDILARRVSANQVKFRTGRQWQYVTTQESHIAVHTNHANACFADFLFLSPLEVEFDAIPNLSTNEPTGDLHLLAEMVQSLGYKVLLADVTTEDVRSVGFSVVRVLIPGFHPLFIGHRFRALGGTRLWRVPQNLGYAGIEKTKGDNPIPHPFA
jgi:ribosomal protein S12 methylthiotransferase accessory factor